MSDLLDDTWTALPSTELVSNLLYTFPHLLLFYNQRSWNKIIYYRAKKIDGTINSKLFASVPQFISAGFKCLQLALTSISIVFKEHNPLTDLLCLHLF